MKHWPAEFQPRSLCDWGGDSDGGGGFGGAGTGGGDWGSAGSGGFGGGGFDAGGGLGYGGGSGDFGGPATGGGDWGSSGSFSAAGMFGYTDASSYAAAMAASPGGFYDTGGPGIAPGALGAEFGGTFGLSGISGQPGDPQGAFGAELDAGGGGLSGVGRAIESWGRSTPATEAGWAGSYADLSGGFGGVGSPGTGGGYTGTGGGLFGDYGGGRGGYTGGGYTGSGRGGGFTGGSTTGGGSSGGRSSGGRSSVTDTTPGYTGHASGGTLMSTDKSEGPGVGGEPSGGPSDIGGGRGEGPEAPEAPEADTPAAAPSTFGTPETSAPDTTMESGPAVAPTSTDNITTIGGDPALSGASVQDAPTAFGPQSLDRGTPDYQGSPYADMGPQQGPSYDYQGSPYADMGPSQSQQDVNWGSVFEGAAPGAIDWGSVFEGAAPLGERGTWADLPSVYSTGITNLINSLMSRGPDPQVALDRAVEKAQTGTPQWAQNPRGFELFDPKADALAQSRIDAKSGWDINTYLSQTNQTPLNQAVFNAITGVLSPAVDPMTDTNWGAVFEGAAPAAQDLSTQLGIQNVGDPGAVDWGSVFEGAAPATDLATQLGTQDIGGQLGIDPGAAQYATAPDPATQLGIESIAPVDWGSVFEAPAQEPNWGAVFEGAPSDIDWGAVFEGAPSVDPNATVDPTMESGAPVALPSTDTTATPGGDPALSGASVDAANAAAAAAAAAAPGAPATGAPGQPGVPGAPPPAGGIVDPGVSPDATVNAASIAAEKAGVSPEVGDAVTQAVGKAQDAGLNPTDLAGIARDTALEKGATLAQADAIAAAVHATAVSQAEHGIGTVPGGAPAPSITSTIPGGRTTDFSYPTSSTPQQAQPGLIDMGGQPGTSATIPGGRTTDFTYPSSTSRGIEPGAEQYGVEVDDDTPEPPDTPPEQDPNAPRPPGNVPGQLIGARDNYPNSHLDNPRNPFYQNSGRTDYRQGRPGVDYLTARQAGVVPNFRVGDYNVQDLDARLVENINRAIVDMERAGIPNTLTVSSAYRPSTRAEAAERGMDERTSQESVYARGHAPGGQPFAAGRPGGSNHGPGRALDFNPGLSGRALTWLREHAREYGLETLGSRNGRPYDVPHIQLQGGGRGPAAARPSAQQQAEQRAIDAQNRQAAIDRGQAPARQAGVPTPRARPGEAPQAEVAQPGVAPPTDYQGAPYADMGVPAQQPTALPPQEVPLDAPRPPADIPIDIPVQAPAPFLTPPRAGRVDPVLQTRFANDLLKDATKNLTAKSGEADFQAASVVAAKALAAAGIPLAMARNLMAQGAYQGAARNGYDINSFPMGGVYKSKIDGGIDAALQGYSPAKAGPAQGPYGFQPDAPAAPGKRSEAPFGQQFAGLSQSTGPAPPAGWSTIPGLDRLSPLIAPPEPPPSWGQPPAPPPAPLYTPTTPGMFSPFRGNEAALPGTRYLAKGGRVADDEPVVVGEEGPEVFVPDRPGTVFPHMPQPGGKGNVDRWPKVPAPEYPGRYGGVEREIRRQTRDAQDPSPGLMDLIDSGRLRLNAANWQRMLNDPALIALGRSRIEANREGIDPGAEQYGAFIPASAPAMAPPDPANPMAQALGYGSIVRPGPRPLRIGRQSYSIEDRR